MSTAALSQGPALSQAGSDLLRSKSLDRNSYDSGDWFNAIHWDCHDGNGFGRGLPPAWDNEDKWPYAKPLLTLDQLSPGCAPIRGASAAYRDLQRIASTEEALSLETATQVQEQVSFPLSGSAQQVPGVIAMEAGDLVVVFNASPERQALADGDWRRAEFGLHPVQASGADEVVKSASFDADDGSFSVPGRTVAVFQAD